MMSGWIKDTLRWIRNGSTPWADGYYVGKEISSYVLHVQGENLTFEGAMFKEGDPLTKGTWKYGNFGEADPAIAEATGKKFYNWEMEAWGGQYKQKGVVSDDGKQVTCINMWNALEIYQWLSDEEFEAFKDSCDPADAPSSHHKAQPDNLGKFLFISGAPGLGKSTTGLLLSKMAGYVYYEADCFMGGTNPYLPPDAKEPSMDAQKQKPLKGMSQERIDAIKGGMTDFMKMIEGKEYDIEPVKSFYSAMCKDLANERKRLGGNWAIAQAVPFRSLRDLIRAELGPDLIFVVLNMKKEDQKKRLAGRHGESEDVGFDINALLGNAYNIYEPATEDEPNAIDVEVTADMTREDVVEKILKMVQDKEKKESTPWADGYYVGKEISSYALLVQGENLTFEGAMFKEGDPLAKGTWKYGDFGEAHPAVAEATGKKYYNWEMEAWGGQYKQKGVVSDDGKQVSCINMMNELETYQWMSDEEFEAFKDSGDPADAPPSHYEAQPDNLGKFLFISGAPGLGKSTTGLLLSKMAGYVYYEADCFMGGTNPYLPPDAKEPSMDAQKQKPLKGMSQERIDATKGGMTDFMEMLEGNEYNIEPIKTFYSAMCKDLANERKRLGGNWAVAQAVPFRSLRDLIRAELGPDLIFVVLNMKKEDQKKRLAGRHGESEDTGFDINALLGNVHDIYEPATEDEPNAIDVEVTADMTREDVVEKILKMVQDKEKKESIPWANGHYISKEQPSYPLLVEGENITMDNVLMKEEDPLAKVTWKYGDFGEADPAVSEKTGKKFYNWQMEAWGGMLLQKGVLSDDGKMVTFINFLKELDSYQWVNEEDYAAFKDSGDPAEAPPCHYKPQPENLGKFLFISGAPGLGKSTTGLLLSKMAGYVYYEADCFLQGTNPYLPLEAKEPSMEASKQKPLKGIPQDRLDAVVSGMDDFMAMIDGKEYNIDKIQKFYSAMCKDLAKERKRLGGDWVVAQAVPSRPLRDSMREELGPDLLFVVLNMKKEDQKKRIIARHGDNDGDGSDKITAMLGKSYDVFEPATEDEPNAIDVEITADMTREDVVEKILMMVEEKKRSELTPWANGQYIAKSSARFTLQIDGQNLTMEGSMFKKDDPMSQGTWKYGDFGEADPTVVEATGKKWYNWEMEAWGGMIKQKGVLSDDGKKVTFINFLKKLDTYEWLSEEDYATFMDSFDSADAPPSHYKPQPENPGKFLFISGAPGSGKSTTGLILSQKAGYVYYEADCFMQASNPYLPPNSKEPSLDYIKQKPLKGIPQDRLDAVSRGTNDMMAMFHGKEYNLENIKAFYSAMCKDLVKERERLGGDWVVAQAVPFRSLRDHMRTELGPDLVFVVLNMKKEDQRRRLEARYGEGEVDTGFDVKEKLGEAYGLFEPATEDEPNAIDVEVTADMTREDVVEKILKMI